MFPVAYADFNSIAIIACCVARQTFCRFVSCNGNRKHVRVYFRKCKGNSFKHDEHDILFGGKKIYLACAASWIIAFFTLLPDIVGVKKVRILTSFNMIVSNRRQEATGGLDLSMVVILSILLMNVPILVLF